MSIIIHLKKFLPLGIFLVLVLATTVFGLSRKFAGPQNEIFVQLKISQGVWWSMSGNPPIWLAKAIEPGNTETDIFGKEIARVIDRTYYPSEPLKYPNQYEVYVTLKLAVSRDSGTDKYRYKRNILSTGSPISVDLSSSTLTGTIMQISQTPIEHKYQLKKITLYDQFGYYSDSPLNYESIKVGDKYFDGQNDSFVVTRKYLGPRLVYVPDLSGKLVTSRLLTNQNIYIEASLMVQEVSGMYFFGEEQRVSPGANLNIITNSQDFSKFTVVKVE